MNPCPFCGKNNATMHSRLGEAVWNSMEYSVKCESCGAQGPAVLAKITADSGTITKAKTKALVKWNERSK
jgi:Lar family restriction alleviation protein